ncbi:MAG: MobF family relaxase [Tepidisphaeraceae bacterium]
MLRMYASTSASKAKTYYSAEFSKEGYYSEGHELVGHWGGKGAAMLALSGRVDKDRFDQLCDNIDPRTGEKLTLRTKSTRRVGYDMNWNATKSVSILHAFTRDDRILHAFRRSVQETMAELENKSATRVRKGGQDVDRITGNLVYGEFLHFTSRPVDGKVDPHLHAHVYTFNATWDYVEQAWKAVQFGDLKRDAPYYERAFHNRLATYLEQLGYQIERRGRFFEVVGIDDKMIRTFSKRTEQIEALQEKLGISDPDQKGELGAQTREHKMKELSREQLDTMWRSWATPEQLRTIEQLHEQALARSQGRSLAEVQLITPPRDPHDFRPELMALEAAMLHCFERASAVHEIDLLGWALHYGVGKIDPVRLRELVATHPDLIRGKHEGREVITTQDVLKEEIAMVDWVLGGQGRRRALAPDHVIQSPILNDEQRAAVRHVHNSMDAVTGIHGRSGTGKTTVMHETIDGIEAAGKKVFVFAPTAEASRELLRKEGFVHAETVAELLTNEALQARIKDHVIWIDEAGLLSGRSMAQVATLARSLSARVILSGDTAQHRAVERGDALRILEQHAGLKMAELSQIQRQTGTFREAVKDLSTGKLKEAFEKLEALNAIHEVEREDLPKVLAADYLKSVGKKESVLVISPTHAEIRRVTEAIREGLKQEQRLGKSERFALLERVDMTEAQRGDVRSFSAGQVLEVIRGKDEFKRGQRLEVVRRDDDHLVVHDSAGNERTVPVHKMAKHFQVYERRFADIAVGERLRITQNGRTADGKFKLTSGTLHTVIGFTPEGDIRLDNGKTVGRNYAHVTYGYASTSYSAQGKTVDKVFVAQGNDTFGGASREQFYVSISRAKVAPIIYTNSKEELIESVQASSQRVAALDLKPAARRPEPDEAAPKPTAEAVLSALLLGREKSRAAEPAEGEAQPRSPAERVPRSAEPAVQPLKEQLGRRVLYQPVKPEAAPAQVFQTQVPLRNVLGSRHTLSEAQERARRVAIEAQQRLDEHRERLAAQRARTRGAGARRRGAEACRGRAQGARGRESSPGRAARRAAPPGTRAGAGSRTRAAATS